MMGTHASFNTRYGRAFFSHTLSTTQSSFSHRTAENSGFSPFSPDRLHAREGFLSRSESAHRNMTQFSSCPAKPTFSSQLPVPSVLYRHLIGSVAAVVVFPSNVICRSNRTCFPCSSPTSSYSSRMAASETDSSSFPFRPPSTPPWGVCHDPGLPIRSPMRSSFLELSTAAPAHSLHLRPSSSVTNCDGGCCCCGEPAEFDEDMANL
mmetsp:Transcript_31103/g.75188  ORF Transcript_31103/g.75188 Transcript_31103/m.75188 type:complete len:207 (-) Transcript_31103:92-712(-)